MYKSRISQTGGQPIQGHYSTYFLANYPPPPRKKTHENQKITEGCSEATYAPETPQMDSFLRSCFN